MLATIYALYDPRQPSAVRYVGKTVKELSLRLSHHIAEARTGNACHRGNWIRSLLLAGVRPQIAPLEMCDEKVWQQRERFWIAGHRPSGVLTNNTDGGDGVLNLSAEGKERIANAMRTRVVSAETRAKIGLAVKARVVSEATRQKLSAAHKGNTHGFKPGHTIGKGRILSEETIAKMSKAHKGVPRPYMLGVSVHGAESRAKISEAAKNRVVSEETKAKMRATHIKIWAERKANAALR